MTRSDSSAACRLVLVYVCDSLRRDHLSCYGYGRQTSPHIDELARDSILVEQATAESTWTRPSAASLLTSLYGPAHGVITFTDGMVRGLPVLSGLLQKAGFATAGVSAMGNVSTACGFAEGFDEFVDLYQDDAVLRLRGEGLQRRMFHKVGVLGPVAEPRSEDVHRRALELLDGPLAGRRAFLFLWSIDTHDPYDPPGEHRVFLSKPVPARLDVRELARLKEPWEFDHARDLYDCEIHANDHALGELLGELRRRGLYDDALIVLAADHGEALGEHGEAGHGHLPFEVRTAVPMIIKLPGCRHAGRRLPHLAQLVDVAPTVMDALGVRAPSVWQGRSVLAVLEGRTPPRDCAFCHTLMSPATAQYLAARGSRYKLVKCSMPGRLRGVRQGALGLVPARLRRLVNSGREALFDLGRDPMELAPRATPADLPVRLCLARRLRTWRECCQALRRRLKLPASQTVRLADPRLLRHLEQLGYG